MIKKRIILSKLTPDMWKREHTATINAFLGPVDSYPVLLTAYIDSVSGLVLSDAVPVGSVGEMVYFIRRFTNVSDTDEEEHYVTVESFFSEIQHGVVSGRHIESLLRIMTGVYVPMFFRNTTWPDRFVLLADSSCSVSKLSCVANHPNSLTKLDRA